MECAIAKATYDDINDIVAICEENLLTRKKEKNPSQSGFLVNKISYEDVPHPLTATARLLYPPVVSHPPLSHDLLFQYT